MTGLALAGAGAYYLYTNRYAGRTTVREHFHSQLFFSPEAVSYLCFIGTTT